MFKFFFFLLDAPCIHLLSYAKLHQLPIVSCLDLTGLNLEESTVTIATPCQLWTSGPTPDPLASNSIVLLMPFSMDLVLKFYLQYVTSLTVFLSLFSTYEISIQVYSSTLTVLPFLPYCAYVPASSSQYKHLLLPVCQPQFKYQLSYPLVISFSLLH